MTTNARPSLILNMDVDSRLFSEDLTAEIRRSYSYVAPSVVAPVEAPEDQPWPESTLRLVVRMHAPYWDAQDAQAEATWNAVMPDWLRHRFYKVGATIDAFNEVRAEAGREALAYPWIEVELGDVVVALAADDTGSIPADALPVIQQVRALMGAGALGQGVARVSVPSRSSWEEQLDRALREQASAADGEGGAEGAEDALPEDGAAEEASEGAAPAAFAPFAVDKAEWGIGYADGTARRFHGERGEFID